MRIFGFMLFGILRFQGFGFRLETFMVLVFMVEGSSLAVKGVLNFRVPVELFNRIRNFTEATGIRKPPCLRYACIRILCMYRGVSQN